MFNEVVRKELERLMDENYESDKNEINKSIKDFKNIVLQEYKKIYPFSVLSYNKLKNFGSDLEKLTLLPEKEIYRDLHINNEFYSAQMAISFKFGGTCCIFKIPFLLNISKISRFIEDHHSEVYNFTVDDLKSFANKEVVNDFDKDNLYRITRRDLLVDVKAKNPIIVMNRGKAVLDCTIINGNHRIIDAIKKNKKNINGYFVDPKACSDFAITDDYVVLYKMIEKLHDSVKGIEKWDLE
jgi:hypothetical protein